MTVIMWIIHHLIRPIWSLPIGLFFWVETLIKQKKDLGLRDTIRINRIAYNKLASLSDIIQWASHFDYKWEGALDHDNWPLEFHASYGDCDDAARYTVDAINKLKGYKARRIHIWAPLKGKTLVEWINMMHYVVYFTSPDGNKFIMNYHHVQNVKSLKEGIVVVADWYKSKGYDYTNGNICLW